MPNLSNDFEVRKETLRALGGDPTGLANIFEVDKEILKLISEGGSDIDWYTIKQKLAEDGVESIKFTMGNEEVILTADEVKTLLNQPIIPEGKYMTITVDDEVEGETIIHPNIEGSLPNLNLQYRVNNGSWNDFVFGTTDDIHVVAGDFVQFKGVNENGLSTYYYDYLNFHISGNNVHLSGNVMSLIDGVGDTIEIPNDYCFKDLFSNSNIKTVSSDFLPATTLKTSCYENMFNGCTELENSPELPATTIASSCYTGMFIQCTSLTQAPELPAKTLFYDCYHGMFQGCSNLVKAPEILPATTLAESCYQSMFSGCINLTQAPELHAKTLVDNCYYFMFDNCWKLNYVKSLAVEGLDASSALGSWLNGVASTGTFEKPAGVDYPTGGDGIPTDWTVKDFDMYIEAPKDGNQYARQDGDWVEVSKVKTTNYNTLQFWSGTQEEYDAIATKDANTLYVIS